MPFIPKEEAEILVRPFFDDLEHIVKAAWQDWRNGTLAPQMQHKRVRANFVWNQLIAHAKRRFDGRDGICVETVTNWDGVLVNDKIFVRMKKGTNRLLSRNYPTQAALSFHDQIQDLFGGIARLELLYILNDAETDIERITLIQRHRKTVAWAIDLLALHNEQQNVIPLISEETSTEQGSVADRIIKPKEERKDDEQYGREKAS
ncbi:MAG: hypothetical protein CTY39_11285 [Hyphomicrobium sp.]|nr:MAG: hypothetical protein CTY39_11285 [Hyphomicrobium sp.]